MRLVLSAALIVGSALVYAASPTHAAGIRCVPTSDIFGTHVRCTRAPESGGGAANVVDSDGSTYRNVIQCRYEDGNFCVQPVECVTPPNWIRATQYRIPRGKTFENGATAVAEVCIPPNRARDRQNRPVLTRGMVQRAFERLDWPASRLLTQPPNGATLVNLPTILRTTNTKASTRVVTLLGQRITIEAKPTSYVWHHGDGTSRETSSPGHAYPGPGYRDVTHTYLRASQGLRLSVDTVYTGRYRVGNRPWVDIPEPRTIVGPVTPLTVRTATPHLTGGDQPASAR